MAEKYTFEDWLENRFYNEKDYNGDYVANDSNSYLHLVSMGKIDYETINRIQDAQAEAYEYGIKNTIELKELHFRDKAKRSLDLLESIKLEIESIEKIIEANKELYKFIIDGKTTRGIKFGATFMLPEAYKTAKTKGILDFSLPDFSKYGLNNGEGLTHFPTPEQKKYRQMEVLILWLKILKQKQADLIKPEDLKHPHSFQSIFNPKYNAYIVCIELLEDLEITVNSVCRLKAGKAGPLFGAIAAMRDTHLFFKQDFKDMDLLKFFNGHLKTDYKTFNKRGKYYESGYDDAKTFLKANFKK